MKNPPKYGYVLVEHAIKRTTIYTCLTDLSEKENILYASLNYRFNICKFLVFQNKHIRIERHTHG